MFGTVSDLGARLGIKGSGSTSATTSLLVQNSSGTTALQITDSNLLCLGGTTSSFPAIKRNAAGIDFRLADDSGFAIISSGGLNVNGNAITLVGTIGNTSAMRFDAGSSTGVIRLSTNSVNIGGNTTNNASALLQVDSTTKGFLPPRMTTTERNAIASPAAGLVVYDSTTNKLQCYNGSTWNDLF
jgi:hypothetical protein